MAYGLPLASRAHFGERFLGKLTIAKFIPMTHMVPDKATAVSLTFLPDGLAVGVPLKFSEGFG